MTIDICIQNVHYITNTIVLNATCRGIEKETISFV